MSKKLFKTIVSFFLILILIYQVGSGLKETFEIAATVKAGVSLEEYRKNIDKGLIILLGTTVDILYGYFLILRPLKSTKLVHLLLGLALFVFSLYLSFGFIK